MPKYLLVVGGGKFGEIALKFAFKNGYRTIVIDEDENCLASKLVDIKCNSTKECVSFLGNSDNNFTLFFNKSIDIVKKLINLVSFEYIIPVVPLHLLAKLVSSEMKLNSINLKANKQLTQEFVDQVTESILLNYNINHGIVYLSYALENEICPDNCAGPPNYCPNFNREKPITITNYLRKVYGLKSYVSVNRNEQNSIYIILNSYQLMPGLGGLKGSEIYDIFNVLTEQMKNIQEKEYDIVVGTSCNCHGVLSFLKNY